MFDPDFTHSRISELIAQGYEFKTTAISEEFTYEDFQSKYSQEYVLAIISDKSLLNIVTVDEPVIPAAGETVLALVAPNRTDEPTQPSPANKSQ